MEIPIVLVVPAYRPGPELLDIAQVTARSGFVQVIVVDDGSGPSYRASFDAVAAVSGVRVLRHAVNLGKGAALKTGLNCALVDYPAVQAIVTADADGQHDPEDIVTVARRFNAVSGALVMGVREFSGSIPLRSRIGNSVTRTVMRIVVGDRLTDTQTGLRVVPRMLAEKMLTVPAVGYEFELEMLLAARHLGIGIVEVPIRTIYQPGNASSHFQPLRDSMRIYFVLLRFGLMSIATAILDNLAFFLLYRAGARVTSALVIARALAVIFNYSVVRRAVFHSTEQHRKALPRYLALAGVNLCFSYALLSFLIGLRGVPVMPAKIGVEACLFIANFALQRDFVFVRRTGNGAS